MLNLDLLHRRILVASSLLQLAVAVATGAVVWLF